MKKKELRFERAEFAARVDAVKKEMAKRGIDILFVSEPASQNYLTGYDAYSFYTPQIVAVKLDHPEPIWIGRSMNRVSARKTTYLADENIRAYPEKYAASKEQSAYDFVAGVAKELGGEKARIGVEMGSLFYPAQAHADLVGALPLADIVNADLLVNWLRIVLSPAEISLMREAGRITDAMMERAIEVIEPGVRECDVAGAVYNQQMSGTADFGGTYSSSPAFLCVGENSVEPHAAWTDKPLPASTIVNLELYGVRHRYQVNLARSICIGKPAPAYQRLSEVVVEALNAGLDEVRPGRTCEEVAEAFSRVLARHGHEKEARLGYPLGIGFPPSGHTRTASLRKGDKTVLKPGMCFHMMSGLWLDEVGITITQSFTVTENGHEPLTVIPRKLFVK